MLSLLNNIRSNLAGDHPKIDPSSLIDPSAQIIGNVEIGKDVFVGPLTVIRADQRGPDGKVGLIKLEEEVNIQDGVIIHAHPGTAVTIGPRTSIAHAVVIHGPCTVGEACFLAIRSILYSATLEDNVWLGMGALVMKTALSSFTKVPAGKVIRGLPDVMELRLVTDEEKEYMQKVLTANSRLRVDYLELRSKAKSIKSSVEGKAGKEPI
ncbi:MAG: hexapeptide transferase [Deltaproteobacteria bacterium]|nr:hexapeptide transferase [Deltaproteobacteria bacterium]MBW2343195.1 hexapeptide transferase [Deltaproteobacteria bacterium]